MKDRLRTVILRLVARLSRPWSDRFASPSHPGPTRILLIRPDHIGDLLFTTPAIRALRTSLPDAHITCMVGPWAEEIVRHNQHLDEILICPYPGFTRRPKRHVLAPYMLLWRQARMLRARSFDAALILRFDHWWGAMLACWAGIPRRVGYALPTVLPFLSESTPYWKDRHEVEQNMRLISAIAGRDMADPGPLEFSVQPDAVQSAAQLLADVEPEQGLACLHPGAGAPVKLWREDAFARVGDVLNREYGLRVVITGSPGDRSLTQAIAQRMETNPLVIAGQTSLGELAAVMAQSRLVIGVDSGPLHLAVSQAVPTIHLFGPVDHRTFGPWGDPGKHIVIVADRACVPCNRLDYELHELDDHPCVRCIPVAQVLEAAGSLLGSNSPASAGVL
jgi:lipopolysaccharide heptosyltransferase II